MSPYLFSADLGATELGQRARARVTVAEVSDAAFAELFGDPLTRALHRETVYAVPDDERHTCPVHLDWRTHCLPLHIPQAAA
jgi:hypothetical protein